MKPTRSPNPPAPASRPIKRFASPAPSRAQPVRPPSDGGTETSREAIRIAKNPPGIDPRQQHN